MILAICIGLFSATFIMTFGTIGIVMCEAVFPGILSTMPSLALFTVDFVVSFVEFFSNILYVIVIFVGSLAIYLIRVLIQILPVVLKWTGQACSLVVWILSRTWRGIFGHGDKTTNTLGWLIVICSVALYIERIFRRQGRSRDGRRNLNQRWQEHRVELDVNGRGPENMNVLPRRPIEERAEQLQNQENENEANNQEEAEQTVLLDDNIRNLERERQRSARYRPRIEPSAPPDERLSTAPPDVRLSTDASDERLCIVCMENERNVALFPCGHTQLCNVCVNLIKRRDNLCPICQRRIREHRQVFL